MKILRKKRVIRRDSEPFPKPVPSKKIVASYIHSDDEDDDSEDDSELEIDPTILSDEIEADEQYIDESKEETTQQLSPIQSDIESEDEDFLQKFDAELQNKYVATYHPECITGNAIEIELLTRITRGSNNQIIDNNHKTNPFLSKYERTRILGQRTKQLNNGNKPYVSVPPDVIEGYLIAELELKAKKIPVIIRRPLANGNSEYWKLSDLEII